MTFQKIKSCIETLLVLSIGHCIGSFLGSPPIIYYLLALIVLFIFWYGLFELMKK